ncbi:MAG: nicotinate phosphoribosyltransferase, partial [Sphaerochaetaceae bacterium]
MTNIILDTDSYKFSHFKQYPPNTTALRAYFEARTEGEDIRFFGLQYILKTHLTKQVTMEDVEEANELAAAHGVPFPYEGWKRVVEEHNGYLPVRIKAVPEGTVVTSGNVLFTVESTDPELFWLTTWIETVWSRVWYPTTVATRSYDLYKFINKKLEETADDPEAEIGFKLHDFGSRGASSAETAGIGGLSHLVNFVGTDTVAALVTARKYYGSDIAGFSIPAAEHSTITSWGREGEVDAFRNMLTQFAKPGALLAVVSDSWDIYNAVENLWGEELRQEVIDSGAIVVVRPDSGDPLEQVVKALKGLEEKFGTTMNSKGFKVLNNVRVIQGDGVNPDTIKYILNHITMRGWSASNIAFGMGAELLQKVNRDTHKFAYKVCEAEVDGEWRPVFKQPVTSP